MNDTAMAAAPVSYRVTAHGGAGGPARVHVGAETIGLDTAWAGTPSGLPGPAELLAAAFAACLLKNLERSRQLLRFDYRRAEVDVTARRQDNPPRFVAIEYELRLDTDEPHRRVALLHYNLRRFGTVYNTLAAVCRVSGRITANGTVADAVEAEDR